jgi:hypothetical protein
MSASVGKGAVALSISKCLWFCDDGAWSVAPERPDPSFRATFAASACFATCPAAACASAPAFMPATTSTSPAGPTLEANEIGGRSGRRFEL